VERILVDLRDARRILRRQPPPLLGRALPSRAGLEEQRWIFGPLAPNELTDFILDSVHGIALQPESQKLRRVSLFISMPENNTLFRVDRAEAAERNPNFEEGRAEVVWVLRGGGVHFREKERWLATFLGFTTDLHSSTEVEWVEGGGGELLDEETPALGVVLIPFDPDGLEREVPEPALWQDSGESLTVYLARLASAYSALKGRTTIRIIRSDASARAILPPLRDQHGVYNVLVTLVTFVGDQAYGLAYDVVRDRKVAVDPRGGRRTVTLVLDSGQTREGWDAAGLEETEAQLAAGHRELAAAVLVLSGEKGPYREDAALGVLRDELGKTLSALEAGDRLAKSLKGHAQELGRAQVDLRHAWDLFVSDLLKQIEILLKQIKPYLWTVPDRQMGRPSVASGQKRSNLRDHVQTLKSEMTAIPAPPPDGAERPEDGQLRLEITRRLLGSSEQAQDRLRRIREAMAALLDVVGQPRGRKPRAVPARTAGRPAASQTGLEEKEGVRVATVKELAAVDPELPARLGLEGKAGVALVSLKAVGRARKRPIRLYAHQTVFDVAFYLLPEQWGLDQWEVLPRENITRANELLRQATADAEKAGVVIALDAASLDGLALPENHPLALLLDSEPRGWNGLSPTLLAAFVQGLAERRNLVLDLTGGSIRVVEIPGWGRFYAVDLAQSA